MLFFGILPKRSLTPNSYVMVLELNKYCVYTDDNALFKFKFTDPKPNTQGRKRKEVIKTITF